jgi:isopenicillin N synthase-like dioxygenase
LVGWFPYKPGRGSPSIQQAITVDDAPGGLQVQPCTGKWLDIPSVADGIALNLVDLMMGWANDRWRER